MSHHCGRSGRSAEETHGRSRTGSEGHTGATQLRSENPNPGAVSEPHPTSTGLASWRGALLALSLGLLISMVGPRPVQAAAASPETVRIGAFLTGLSDLEPSKKVSRHHSGCGQSVIRKRVPPLIVWSSPMQLKSRVPMPFRKQQLPECGNSARSWAASVMDGM